MKKVISVLLMITMMGAMMTTANAMTLKEWIKSAPEITIAKNVRTGINVGWDDVKNADVEMYHIQISKKPYFNDHCDWHLDGNRNYIHCDYIGSGGYITGLKDGKRYYVRVRAKIDGKYRKWSRIEKVKQSEIDVTGKDYGELVDKIDLYR